MFISNWDYDREFTKRSRDIFHPKDFVFFSALPPRYFCCENGCLVQTCNGSPLTNMSVLQHFEEYQRARVKFVQAVAEAATRPQNIEVMNNAGVMQLLRPLLLDNVSGKNIIPLF